MISNAIINGLKKFLDEKACYFFLFLLKNENIKNKSYSLNKAIQSIKLVFLFVQPITHLDREDNKKLPLRTSILKLINFEILLQAKYFVVYALFKTICQLIFRLSSPAVSGFCPFHSSITTFKLNFVNVHRHHYLTFFLFWI